MSQNLYDQPLGAAFSYLGKRIVLLAAKLAGFKSLCLVLATVLLVKGMISGSIWLSSLITVICGNTGVRLAGAWQKEEQKEDSYEQSNKKSNAQSDRSAAADPAVQRTIRKGQDRVRALLNSGSNPAAD